MLTIIKNDNGEQWEDYHEWIEKIYDLPEGFYYEWLIHVKYECTKQGVETEIVGKETDRLNIMLTGESIIKKDKMYGPSVWPKKSHLKKLNKIKNTIYEWIESTYNVKPIVYKEIQL